MRGNSLSPVPAQLGGKDEVLAPQGLEALPLLFVPEELMSEEDKEVINGDPHEHGRLYRIESLHGEAAEGKVLFSAP